jgi:hypothetical protein
MVSGFFMMLVDVVIHDPLLGWGCRNIASHHETFATRIWQQKVRPVTDCLSGNKSADSVDNELDRERGKHHAE